MAKDNSEKSECITTETMSMVVDRGKYTELGNAKLPSHPSPPPPPPVKTDSKKGS